MSTQLVSRDPDVVEFQGMIHGTTASAQGTVKIFTDSQTTAERDRGNSSAFPEVQAWCTRLGMLPNVVEDWALWHANPVTAMIWFFTPQYELRL
jgi:hypothetical protein